MILTENKYGDSDAGVMVSIDAGKKASGYGIWTDSKLVACGMAKEGTDLTRHWLPNAACFGRGSPAFVGNRLRGLCRYTVAANTYFQGLASDASKAALWAVTYECYNVPSSPLYGCRPVIFLCGMLFVGLCHVG